MLVRGKGTFLPPPPPSSPCPSPPQDDPVDTIDEAAADIDVAELTYPEFLEVLCPPLTLLFLHPTQPSGADRAWVRWEEGRSRRGMVIKHPHNNSGRMQCNVSMRKGHPLCKLLSLFLLWRLQHPLHLVLPSFTSVPYYFDRVSIMFLWPAIRFPHHSTSHNPTVHFVSRL